MEIQNFDGEEQKLFVEELDEIRKNRAAYDYLCRLHEVQKWLVSQLSEAIVPPPIELEEDLRNGILLARLAHSFLPNFIKTDQIFDIEEEKYESSGLVYNHTDNIIKWRKACLEIGFPEFCIPETVDIYEGRNVRTIFCLHALAHYLHQIQGLPPIKNETGNLEFLPEDIEIAKQRLLAQGFTNCDFRQTIHHHALVKATVIDEIIKAIADGSAEDLTKILSDHKSGFVYVKKDLGEKYFNALTKSYEENQQQIDSKKVQKVIDKVNEKEALHRLENYLKTSSPQKKNNFEELSNILTDFDSDKVIEAAMPYYSEYLTINCKTGRIEPEQLRNVMDECNACIQLKTSLKEGDVDDVFDSLKNPSLNLEDVVYKKNEEEYFQCLKLNINEFDNCIIFTMLQRLREIIVEINFINKLRYYVFLNNSEGFDTFVQKLNIDGYNPSYCNSYMNEIRQNGLKNKNELKKIIQKVNENAMDVVKEKLKKDILDVEDIREVINIIEEISYEEEILIEKRRSKVASLIEVNEKLKTDLEDLEKSLELYKNNEITIDEISKQIEVTKMEEEDIERRQEHDDPEAAKKHRISLNPLEIVFYYLQTDPTYLANFFSWEKIEAKDFVNTIALPIFNFGRVEREEILLVRGFAKILTRYIGSLNSYEQFLDESWDANRIVIAFKTMLQALPSNRIATLFSKSDLAEFKKAEAAEQHLNFSPIQMYEKIHNRHAKSLEEATHDPEVSKVLITSKKFLSKWTLLFTKKAAETLDIPRNVRYLLKICANKLRRHFKNLEKKDADRIVAKFFYSTFFEDYLQNHNKKMIDPSLTKRQKEIIQLIIEMMELGADGKGFSDDFGYMQSLNSTLIQINEIFTSITSNHLIRQGSAFTLNREPMFADGIKPILHIETKYINHILQNIELCKDTVFPDKKAKLRDLLEIVKIPSNKVAILFLKPFQKEKEQIDGGQLLIETKKLVLELLEAGCKGSTIKDLFTHDDEEIVNGYGEISDESDNDSLRAKKDTLSHNLSQLEKYGIISAEDDYDDVLKQISYDLTATDQIQNSQNLQLEAYDRKINELKAKKNEYQDQLEQYRKFIEKYRK